MPRGRLKLGPMDAVGTGEGWCVELHTRKAQTHTRFTQIQGPREEVNPLLLLVCLYMDHNPGYKVAPRAVYQVLSFSGSESS